MQVAPPFGDLGQQFGKTILHGHSQIPYQSNDGVRRNLTDCSNPGKGGGPPI
jgi:hypothetical protein